MARLRAAEHVLHLRAKGGGLSAIEARRETHTTVCCAHPYIGFVSMPNATIDFSDRVPAEFGHRAVAAIDAQGFRNSSVPAEKPGDEFWIGLFGGSAAFGVPASDNAATIAGCLERRLSPRVRRDGKRVRVINLAIPGGQQPQQLIVLLLNRHRLDAAITFDGVNEVVVPACYNKEQIPPDFPYRPYYELLFGGSISDDQICESVLVERKTAEFDRQPAWRRRLFGARHAREIARHRDRLNAMSTAPAAFRSIFNEPRETSAEALALAGAKSWAEHITLMHSLCRARGIDALFVVQPIPDRGKPLTDSERAHLRVYPDIVAVRAAGYARLLAHAEELRAAGCPVVSFEEVFSGCAESIYTDLIHFEDRGSAVAAERLADWIVGHWPGFAA